jgi:hypothetical protein
MRSANDFLRPMAWYEWKKQLFGICNKEARTEMCRLHVANMEEFSLPSSVGTMIYGSGARGKSVPVLCSERVRS